MDKPKSVEEYLTALPEDVRATLEKVRQSVKAAAPTATEKIGYGMPGFSYEGRYLVYYAGFKNHCSFFPASNGVMQEFAKELEKYEVSKGTIRFPIGTPLPATLIKKLVKARIEEIDARKKR
jgi:uncharacterized protein YdhG (YjbR/CyaY superfamily)